jgi:Fe-S-cluster containining protein
MEKQPPGIDLAINLDHRLKPEDKFRFHCGPDVPCFTECCGKLELLLTPYDVFRLRRSLGVTSSEFLENYTTVRWKTAHGFPEIMMQMDTASEKGCPLVTPDGCSVYEDRPGACRIYPLGRAATSKHPVLGTPREFYFIVKELHCRGFEQPREWTVREWIADQGMEEYNRFNDFLMDLYLLGSRRKQIDLGPRQIQMFMMACYNIERFREFIFRSGFLKKIEVAPDLVESLGHEDVNLLEFAFEWLKFALFQEPVLTVKR